MFYISVAGNTRVDEEDVLAMDKSTSLSAFRPIVPRDTASDRRRRTCGRMHGQNWCWLITSLGQET